MILGHGVLELLKGGSTLAGRFDLDGGKVLAQLVDDIAVLALHSEVLEGCANVFSHLKARLHSDIYLYD